VFRENNQEKRLVLIYLANEIMKVRTSCQPSLYKMATQYALGCKCILGLVPFPHTYSDAKIHRHL
jgi:hypothetical protein